MALMRYVMFSMRGLVVLGVSVIMLAACSVRSEDDERPAAAGVDGSATGGLATLTDTSNPAPRAEVASRSPDAAPDFELPLLGNEGNRKGELLSLSQFAGHSVVLNFWYPSCPPCRLEMPDLQQTWENHRVDGVRFIGIQQVGLDSVEDGQKFIEEFSITYPVVTDSEGSAILDFEIIGFPTTIFLDKDQVVARKWTGALNAEKLEEFVRDLLP